ncbi:MAG: DNA topoisomerase [Promethearchaeota archaeon]
MSTMIISEKSKAAQAIADALGSKKTIREGKINVYSVPSKNLYVIPLRGHIMQYENSGKYKKWDLTTNRDIITDPNSISKIPSKYSLGYIRALKKYAKLSNRCINACDADVEGCNIGLIDAFTFVKQANKSIKLDQMWLNTLQSKDIIASFNNTIPPKFSWAFAGESRAKIDAIIGFSATREISLTFRPILKTLGAKFASIGRVQTSLLYLLYLREDLIRNFKPEKYWSLRAQILPNITDPNAIIKIIHIKSPFRDKKIADQTYTKVKNAKTGIITNIKKIPNKVLPPTPLNTSKALMLITKNLHIAANVALKTMENLYLNKVISYPRTDSDKYPPNFDHLQFLQKFVITNTYGTFTQNLFQNKRITPHQGKNWAGDHPPITPILGLDPNSSKLENDLQRKVYDLISRNYLASFGESAEDLKSRVYVDINGESFLGNLKILIKEGFYEIAPFLKPKYDVNISINKGKVRIKEISLEDKESQPPPRYTDTTLLKLMEQKNLGTKSTRPNHIQTLENRQYIKRSNRIFYVLELGFMLIDTLKGIWLPFLDPNFTKEVETRLDDVKLGKRKMDDVVDEVRAEFLKLFDKFRKNKSIILKNMMVLQQTGNIMRGRDNKIITGKYKTKNKNVNSKYKSGYSINEGVSEEKDITTSLCPVCNKSHMKLVITKDRKKFFACVGENCKTYLHLPKKGYPRLLKGTCKICGFNIVKISGKNSNNGKKFQYYVCANCWNKSFETKEKIGMCFNCEKFHIVNGRCQKK